MKVRIVWLQDLDVIGHIEENDPDRVWYIINGVKHNAPSAKADYVLLETVEVEEE